MTRNPALSYADQPTVMWRMQRQDGLSTHLVVGRGRRGVTATWFLNNSPLGARQFVDVAEAVQFSERMQAQNWAVGWRLVDDDGDPPPSLD